MKVSSVRIDGMDVTIREVADKTTVVELVKDKEYFVLRIWQHGILQVEITKLIGPQISLEIA